MRMKSRIYLQLVTDTLHVVDVVIHLSFNYFSLLISSNFKIGLNKIISENLEISSQN